MRKSRLTETQIVSILKEAEAGRKIEDLCREHGISSPTYSFLGLCANNGQQLVGIHIEIEPPAGKMSSNIWQCWVEGRVGFC